ncbi:MAG TPA: MarR family transcriptional regulator [Polyangia bacterium]|nr:MarR family transcriptional regulator [Polyangia bacterium]
MPNQLGKLFRVMARIYNRALVPFEISSVQAHILATLWIEGAMTMGELQARMMLGSSTLTGAVDRMERAGLLRRLPVENDRRAYRLQPVTWPQRKADALLETLDKTEGDVFRGLTAAEHRTLSTLLQKALAPHAGADDE